MFVRSACTNMDRSFVLLTCILGHLQRSLLVAMNKSDSTNNLAHLGCLQGDNRLSLFESEVPAMNEMIFHENIKRFASLYPITQCFVRYTGRAT